MHIDEFNNAMMDALTLVSADATVTKEDGTPVTDVKADIDNDRIIIS
jgi:hypothetical protein